MRSKLAAMAALAGAIVSAPSFALPVSEVAELQFHKVDQLVATRKIDRAFLDHLKSVQIEKDPAGANFLVTFAQEADAGKTASLVRVKANAAGKAVGYAVSAGSAASEPANWGGKAPLDLLEKSVEYVVDTTANPILVPFREGFTSATITPMTGAQGLHGRVEVLAGPADGILEVMVDLNGKVLSAERK